jgi:spore germination protein
MSKMRQRVVIPILFLGLLVATVWGYTQFQGKRQWEISAENQYQRAYQELSTHVNNMEAEMTKSLVAASFHQTIRLLTNIWREANSCQENLGQLPLTSMELSGTKKLLANVSSFCFNTMQERLLKGTDINEAEWGQIKVMRDRTRVMVKHLENLQQQFYNNSSRWLDVDRMTVGAAGMTQISNNKVTKSFLMLEDGLKRVPDVGVEGNNQDFEPKPTGLTGKNVSIKEAEAIATRCVAPDYPGAKAKFERIIRGGFPSYMMRISNPGKRNRDLRVSVSVKGGHVAWLLGSRDVKRSHLSLKQCRSHALTFLRRNGYGNMQVVAEESFDNVTTLTYAREQNKVLYYPEMVKLQVAQDNGEVMGCDFIPFLSFNEPNNHTVPKPKYSEERVRRLLNPHLKQPRVRLAQVLDEMYNKVLCYEVAGTQGNDRFLIYYNASTGKEEKIRRVDRYGNDIV